MRKSPVIVLAACLGSWLFMVACNGDDKTGTDAGDAASSGGDACAPVEGGLACDPGHVTCGTTSCDLTKQFCCINDAGNTCTNNPPDSGPPPKNSCTGETKVLCDEAADCPSGQICCGFVGATGGFTTSCQTSCGTGLQFCRESAECTSGACTPLTCRGESIETCGSFCP